MPSRAVNVERVAFKFKKSGNVFEVITKKLQVRVEELSKLTF